MQNLNQVRHQSRLTTPNHLISPHITASHIHSPTVSHSPKMPTSSSPNTLIPLFTRLVFLSLLGSRIHSQDILRHRIRRKDLLYQRCNGHIGTGSIASHKLPQAVVQSLTIRLPYPGCDLGVQVYEVFCALRGAEEVDALFAISC